MNKSKRNKKRVTKRRSKKNYVAKLIKLDKKGNTLVVFNKAVPKRVVKKVLNNMDSGDYVDLCRMQNTRNRHTFKRVRGKHRYKQGRKTKGRYSRSRRSYIAKGGSVDPAVAVPLSAITSNTGGYLSASTSALLQASGPVGGILSGLNNAFRILGGTSGILVFGAGVATLMYALKKSKIKLEDSEESKEPEIDYMDEKIKQLADQGGPCVRLSERKSSERGDYKNLSKSVLAKAPCPRNRRGSSPARIELWQKQYDNEDEEEKDRDSARREREAAASRDVILAS